MNKPDRIAHVLGVVGFILAPCSLLWQIFTYRESRLERITARVSLQHTYKENEDAHDVEKKGDVSVELVNIGQQALYLRRVSIEPCVSSVGRENLALYEAHGPSDFERLEPSASRSFWRRNWQSEEIPLFPEDEESQAEYCVVVQSTKGEILHSPVKLAAITITSGPFKPQVRNK